MKPGGNSGGLLAVAILADILGTLAVALRLYTRKIVLNQIWVDDYFAVVSWLGLIGLTVQNYHNISTGLGSHFSDIPRSVQNGFYQDLWLGLVIYNITCLFTKATLFFQFFRIIRQTNAKKLKIISVSIMVAIAAWQIAQVFIQIFACVPISLSWDKTVKGYCQTVTVTRTMNSIGNIVTDFIILLLPLPIIWRLALPRRSRYAVMGIFCLGFFTCIVSILRVALTSNIGSDIAWETVPVIAWTTAEVLTGVIIASLSTMRPLVSRYVPGFSIRGTTKGTSKASRATYASKYGLQNLGSRDASRISRSDQRSTLMSPSKKFNGSGGYMDLSETPLEYVPKAFAGASRRMQDDTQLESGYSPSAATIRVTKEWSVQEEH